ncbi:transporter substrate-binding domain-containing protein, partial [Pseudomonas aeruginosa]
MLKIKQWLGAAGVALAVAAIAQPARADELSDIIKRGELRVAVQTSGPLMSFMDKSGKRTGLAVEVAKRMADDLGVKLVLQDYE